MRQIYKCSAIVGIIIVIELSKHLSGTIWSYRPFHTFFSSLQFVLLLWLVVSLLLDLTLFQKLPQKEAIRKTTVAVLVSIAVLELVTVFALHNPQYIPRKAVPAFRNYYDIFHRNIIQFDPNCARYDSSLFYTLLPRRQFRFDNLEFKSAYSTNSHGLRDDETSLEKPEVIVLGDSYAMGWGVEQDETFPEQLATMTGKKVLNAGISSYGTVRELKILNRLDTSRLRYLIIQYCNNDFEENEKFVSANYQLPISDIDQYEKAVRFERWKKPYFPGKHFTTVVKSFLHTRFRVFAQRLIPKHAALHGSPGMTLEKEVQNFLEVLYRSSVNFEKTKVLVIDLTRRPGTEESFIEKAGSLVQQVPLKEKFKKNLLFIPVVKIFDDKDYLILDPHLRATGHKKIAALLTPYLKL